MNGNCAGAVAVNCERLHIQFAARSVVNQLKREFGQSISVNLILKNHDNSDRIYKANIDKVDHHVPEKYTAGEVRTLTVG